MTFFLSSSMSSSSSSRLDCTHARGLRTLQQLYGRAMARLSMLCQEIIHRDGQMQRGLNFPGVRATLLIPNATA